MKWKMKGHLIKDKPHISEEFSEEQWKTRVPVDSMESSHKPTICPHQPIFKAAEDAVYFVVFGLVYTCVFQALFWFSQKQWWLQCFSADYLK